MRKPPGAAATKSGSVPRNKMANNKKSKARKADKREELEQKRKEEAEKAKQAAQPAKASGGNNVPKDEDIVGGEAGKTFTTTTHHKVPVWYAKVREERGNN